MKGTIESWSLVLLVLLVLVFVMEQASAAETAAALHVIPATSKQHIFISFILNYFSSNNNFFGSKLEHFPRKAS